MPTASIAQVRELHERNRDIYREKRAFIMSESVGKSLSSLSGSDYSLASVIHVHASRVSRQGFASLIGSSQRQRCLL